MYSVKWIKSSLFFPWWDGTVDCWQCYLLATSWKGTSTTWNSIWVFSESLLWNNSTKAVTERILEISAIAVHIHLPSAEITEQQFCAMVETTITSPDPLLEFTGHWSPYYQIKCHVLNGMKMLPCFVFCFYKMNYGFSIISAHRISCISKDRIVDNLQFQATTKKLVLFPHKFVKFIPNFILPFLSLPLHCLLESKCHWKRSTFGLIWNVNAPTFYCYLKKIFLKKKFFLKFLV